MEKSVGWVCGLGTTPLGGGVKAGKCVRITLTLRVCVKCTVDAWRRLNFSC